MLFACLLLAVSIAGSACRSSSEEPLPKRIDRVDVGVPVDMGPCGSWIGPGIAAAYCAAGVETPAPSGYGLDTGQIEFTGTERAAAEGGIAQAVGTLPAGRGIGIKVDSATHGTLVAQGLCGHTSVAASFRAVRFSKGDRARIRITRVRSTPVILLRQNGRDVAPDREVLRDLTWMPLTVPEGCAFSVR